MHIFWSCKHLTSFWNKVFCTILNIGIDLFPPDFRRTVTHTLLSGRMLITRKWKSNLSPYVSEVIDMVKQNFAFKSLLVYRHGTKQICELVPVLSLLHLTRPPSRHYRYFLMLHCSKVVLFYFSIVLLFYCSSHSCFILLAFSPGLWFISYVTCTTHMSTGIPHF